MFTPLASLREMIAKRRAASRAKDRGAGFVEYGAVILLVAAIAGVVIATSDGEEGIGQAVKTLIESAIGEVSSEGGIDGEE